MPLTGDQSPDPIFSLRIREAKGIKIYCLKPARSEEGSLRDEIPQEGFGDTVPNVPSTFFS